MPTRIARAPRRARAAAAPRAEIVEQRLRGFRTEVQDRVRALAARHPWIADLAVSFPALLFALAFPRPKLRADDAIRLTMAGAPLATIAVAAGAPMWMRTFPAQAFAAPIPALPDGAEFRRRIVNHLPKRWRSAPKWIEHVANAAHWGDETIALWFAREAPLTGHKKRPKRRRMAHHHQLVCLWAWFSEHSDTRAGTLMRTRWNADMKWAAAETAALQWMDDVRLHLWLGERSLEDVWLAPGVVDGYEFAPLRSAADVQEEAAAMQNCVRGYGADLAENYYRLWSIRTNGERIATLCLGLVHPSAPLPHIVELSAAGNAAAPAEVWRAARRWLHAQDAASTDPRRFKERRTDMDEAMWRAMFRAYWLAKRRIPEWLPLSPDPGVLWAL
jgi:hypothetical protein